MRAKPDHHFWILYKVISKNYIIQGDIKRFQTEAAFFFNVKDSKMLMKRRAQVGNLNSKGMMYRASRCLDFCVHKNQCQFEKNYEAGLNTF